MNEHELIAPGVNRQALAALLERHQLGPLEQVEPLNAPPGALLVNDRLVVRCEAESLALRKEALIYRRLNQLVDVPGPDIVVLDTSRDLLPCDVLIVQSVAGVSGISIWPELDLVRREQLSEQLGRICGAIHSLPWAVYGGLVPDNAEELQSGRWTDIVLRKATRIYTEASQRNLLPQPVLDAFATAISDGDAIFDTAEMPVLAHSDLGMWNVLLQENGSRWQIAGIIGWQSALIADPAWEFASLWSAQIDGYPLPDSFMHGYRDRHIPPKDLRIRQRLYRTIYHLDQVLRLDSSSHVEPEALSLHLTAIQRLLTPR